MDEPERWRIIVGFSSYSVSNYGRIKNNDRDRLMSASVTNFGHAKISLWSERTGRRHTRSVALLVAEAFCKKPDRLSDSVVMLDGFLENVFASNLVWRPRWFAWKYVRQLHTPIHRYYENLPLINITEDVEYRSIVECGMTEGLLFDDIWRSTYTAKPIYPHYNIYQILK